MDFVSAFIEKHRLPASFRVVAESHYLPVCQWVKDAIAMQKTSSSQPLVLGINGAQGTGKSTLADFIAESIRGDGTERSGLRVAVVSIDDFYLTKAARLELSERIHPLLATRGVPGSHDLPLAFDVLNALIAGQAQVALPRFDKSTDDRSAQSGWPITDSAVDLIILEGWCVGSIPQAVELLDPPINSLEAEQDADCRWRTYVNQCLSGEYQRLYAMMDHLILLKAPDFESVYGWRLDQERKLEQKLAASSAAAGDRSGMMNEAQISRFIQHYERLTRHNLKVLPERADLVLTLDRDHQVLSSL